jgi:hypothetical protein
MSRIVPRRLSHSSGTQASVSLGRSPTDFILIAVKGNSVYLWRRLAHLLRLGQPVLHFSRNTLFVFTYRGVHFIKEPFFPDDTYQYMQCHVDLDAGAPLPIWLLSDTPYFIVQAASPKRSHTAWTKQRELSVIFVFNPPSQVELFNA